MASPADRHPSRRPGGAATGGTIITITGRRQVPAVRAIPDLRSSVSHVRCPSCSSLDDKVVDSRTADDGSAIRRRRECADCGFRFTTFERVEELPLVVVKRSGDRVPFDRTKIEAGVRAAAKGRPVRVDQVSAVADEIEELMRAEGPEVTSERIGVAVLDHLREVDKVAYVRFASVYKGFDDPADFEREIGLLTKETAPKRH